MISDFCNLLKFIALGFYVTLARGSFLECATNS